jgi:hypothetical protein
VTADILISGSKFKTAYAALRLRQLWPEKSISIKEKKDQSWGIYEGLFSEDYALDIGCQLFDANDKKFMQTFDIDLTKVIPVAQRYASINGKGITESYAIFDFRKYEHQCHRILEELLHLGSTGVPCNLESLLEYYRHQFGPSALDKIDSFSLKLCGVHLDEIDFRSQHLLPFKRLLLASSDETGRLKEAHPFLEPKLASISTDVHDYSKGFIVFTFPNGTRGFIEHTNEVLEKCEIDSVSDGKGEIEINLEDDSPLKEEIIPIPLHLVYFLTRTFPYTYIQDFSSSPVWRVSSPGHYTRQKRGDYSYVCFEIADPEKRLDRDSAFQMARDQLNMLDVKGIEYRHKAMPFSYPSLYRASRHSPADQSVNPFLYSRQSIMRAIDVLIESITRN